MGLRLIAAAFMIIWMVEYFGYGADESIHFFLLIAVLIVVGKTVAHFVTRSRASRQH